MGFFFLCGAIRDEVSRSLVRARQSQRWNSCGKTLENGLPYVRGDDLSGAQTERRPGYPQHARR
jgi:hypothetical protein